MKQTVARGRFSSDFGEQEWRSGENARLPPMCPRFNSWTRRHMWAELVELVLYSAPKGKRAKFQGYQ